MRRLLPDVVEEDLASVYDGLRLVGPIGRRAGVSLGMVSSVDGAASIAGRTAALGDAADRTAFGALRAAADAVLVGAGTVRAENYGPAAGSAERRRRREQKGLSAAPRLVVVSNGLDLDPGARLFADPAHPPLLATNARAAAGNAQLGEVAEYLVAGEERVDLRELLLQLAARGLGAVLCEGGPSLNAALLADDLVDELYLTLAPVLVGGSATRIVAGPTEAVQRMELAELREHDGELLLRYRRDSLAPTDRL
ncbi:dihydrofolate reductase family protein [Egicoccus sp. AB-alg2]|uniref:dihydrofolate reductase family protein n=1 Tax=Egicoccus sp. AB-alg2 TaxID=3242693 RepID=UPI00359DFAB3